VFPKALIAPLMQQQHSHYTVVMAIQKTELNILFLSLLK